jgi:inosose dehydratase
MLDKLVEEYKIPIAIHNHGPAHKWGKPEVILEAVKDHHALIGLCCDCGHFLRADVDPVHAIKVLKGRVFGFHIKDFSDEKTEASAGDARLNIVELLKEARAQKFDGSFSLEYELEPKNPIPGMAKGLENVRKAVASLG